MNAVINLILPWYALVSDIFYVPERTTDEEVNLFTLMLIDTKNFGHNTLRNYGVVIGNMAQNLSRMQMMCARLKTLCNDGSTDFDNSHKIKA